MDAQGGRLVGQQLVERYARLLHMHHNVDLGHHPVIIGIVLLTAMTSRAIQGASHPVALLAQGAEQSQVILDSLPTQW